MGKRKSRKAAAPAKKTPKVPKTFDCPFCSHTGSVECNIDLKDMIAEAVCGVCKERFATAANALTEPIDVYSEWIDECEKVNQDVDVDDR